MNLFRFFSFVLLSAKNKQDIIFKRIHLPKFEFNEKIMMETILVNL
jgi:hypothetical protein